jgi:hypothetical protein
VRVRVRRGGGGGGGGGGRGEDVLECNILLNTPNNPSSLNDLTSRSPSKGFLQIRDLVLNPLSERGRLSVDELLVSRFVAHYYEVIVVVVVIVIASKR